MTVNNSLTNQKPKFSELMQTTKIQSLINQTLTDPKRVARFVAGISSAVAVNPGLQRCEGGSVITAALVGESLNLSPSPALGQYYIVPYADKGQFMLGWRGYVSLAMRSNQYRKLIVTSVKEGELKSYNPFTEEYDLVPITDINAREKMPSVGYYAMFELTSGFVKSIYWSKEKVLKHATKYSQAFRNKSGNSPWLTEEGFEDMAYKTLLRQLISKHGVMSNEMQMAYEKDFGVIHEDGKVEYVDNDNKTNFEPIAEPIEIVKDDSLSD